MIILVLSTESISSHSQFYMESCQCYLLMTFWICPPLSIPTTMVLSENVIMFFMMPLNWASCYHVLPPPTHSSLEALKSKSKLDLVSLPLTIYSTTFQFHKTWLMVHKAFYDLASDYFFYLDPSLLNKIIPNICHFPRYLMNFLCFVAFKP